MQRLARQRANFDRLKGRAIAIDCSYREHRGARLGSSGGRHNLAESTLFEFGSSLYDGRPARSHLWFLFEPVGLDVNIPCDFSPRRVGGVMGAKLVNHIPAYSETLKGV